MQLDLGLKRASPDDASNALREKATAPACRSDVVTHAFHDVTTFLSSARRPPISFVLISVGSLEPPYEGHCVKPVARECDSATRIRGTGFKTPTKRMQLDLGLKRASPDDGARNPPGPPKTYSVQCYTGKGEGFSHHPRIERSCPNSPQRLPYTVFGRSRSRSLYDARPSLSAAAVAAVTRNLESLSGL
jgi:hypothetical protein